jgi:aklavinone 12-hydroxylase
LTAEKTGENQVEQRIQDESRVGVLVVGAGLAGLSTAMFLAQRGVDVLIVEKHTTTSVHPRAAGQNPRTMELLRSAGIADEVVGESHDISGGMIIKVAASVRGEVFQSISAGSEDVDTSAISEEGWGMATQDRVEPIMLARARELGATARFGVEVDSVEQDADGVTVHLHDRASGQRDIVRADYVIAADGHRSAIREALGIGRHGKDTLSNSIGVVFEADLSDVVDQSAAVVYYLRNPAFAGAFGSVSGRDRYVFNLDYDPSRNDAAEYTEDKIRELLRIAVDEPELEPKILGISAWEIGAQVADRFRDGRIFLVGDSAKVNPPTGGMGGNTAIGDAFDLAWKLAAVLAGQAGPALLDTYEAERQPVAELVVTRTLHNARERMGPEEQLDLSDRPEPLEPNTIVFGVRYRSAAIVSDSSDDDAEDPLYPSGRPGFRAPYVAVTGVATSTTRLFGLDWVLIAGPDGAAWLDAADQVAVRGVQVGVQIIDENGAVTAKYGIGTAGASLIRPDGVVAWRTDAASPDPAGTLNEVLTQLLAKRT